MLLVITAAVFATALLATQPPRHPVTAELLPWLQRRLDRGGGLIVLPRLPDGRCYQTRGLWVSHSHTTISSDGACLTVAAPGPVRLRSADGDPIAASAAFFIAHSSRKASPPSDITIRGLRIDIQTPGLDGVDVYANHVHLSGIQVDGSPFDDVYIGGRTNLTSYSSDITLDDSTLLDAGRNGISITAAVGVQIAHDTIAGAGDGAGIAADPGDGIDVEPNQPADPIERLDIAADKIVGNIHQGIALRLEPGGHLCAHAGGIAITDSDILGNGPFGGDPQISISGGQAKGDGRIVLAGNHFAGSETSLAARPLHERVIVSRNTHLSRR